MNIFTTLGCHEAITTDDIGHLLITGPGGFGKTSALRTIALAASQTGAQVTAISLADPVGLRSIAPRLGVLATSTGQATALLLALGKEAKRRDEQCRTHGVERVRGLDDPPSPLWVLVEEVWGVVAKRPDEDRTPLALALSNLARMGERSDIHLALTCSRFLPSLLADSGLGACFAHFDRLLLGPTPALHRQQLLRHADAPILGRDTRPGRGVFDTSRCARTVDVVTIANTKDTA